MCKPCLERPEKKKVREARRKVYCCPYTLELVRVGHKCRFSGMKGHGDKILKGEAKYEEENENLDLTY